MPKIVDHAAYRTHLLDGCLPLAADRGYGELTMREIADALAVSTGTLYHYFDGKRDLFLTLVEHLTERVIAGIRATVGSQGDPTARFEALLSVVAEREEWIAAYNRICLDHLRERPSGGDAVMAATMARATDALAEALEVRPADARFLFVALLGLITERDLDGGAVSFDEQADRLRTWFSART